jgi:hypothetical protein
MRTEPDSRDDFSEIIGSVYIEGVAHDLYFESETYRDDDATHVRYDAWVLNGTQYSLFLARLEIADATPARGTLEILELDQGLTPPVFAEALEVSHAAMRRAIAHRFPGLAVTIARRETARPRRPLHRP